MFKQKLIGVLVLAGFASTGCGITTRRERGMAIGGGLATAALGVAMFVAMDEPDRDSNGDGFDTFPEGGEIACALGGCVLAAILVAVGGGLTLAGVNANIQEDRPPPSLLVEAAPAPARLPALPPSALRPLPEVATDDTTLRMAKQARSAALGANCPAVRVILRDIELRDQRYYGALLASPVLDGCR